MVGCDRQGLKSTSKQIEKRARLKGGVASKGTAVSGFDEKE